MKSDNLKTVFLFFWGDVNFFPSKNFIHFVVRKDEKSIFKKIKKFFSMVNFVKGRISPSLVPKQTFRLFWKSTFCRREFVHFDL